MKRFFSLLLIAIAALTSYAESHGDNLRKQADEALAAQEYIKARYLYLKAYEAYVREAKTADAVPCAVNVASLYHRENYYKEALEILSAAEHTLNAAEETAGSVNPALHYPIARERQKMYLKLRNSERANDQLQRMKTWSEQAADSLLTIDFLSASAQQYYMFGQTDRGDAAVNSLIALYQNRSDYDKADQCYKDLIDVATRTGNSRLISRTYEKYLAWSDSVAAVKANARYAALQEQYDQANEEIASRDSSLTAKTAIIVGLCILAGILAAALVFGAILLLRYIALSRRQKKQIETAQAHNELKTKFIANISAQMEPTLDTLPPSSPAVKALRSFTGHIQELSNLESSLSEIYPTELMDITKYSNEVADKIRDKVADDVRVIVDAPKMSAPISEEQLTRVLDHLLNNAALHTPAGGRISLEVKKRGPHNIQFIVTNSGEPMDPEKQAEIFKPFVSVRDLTKGDGLGLPICSLLTTKMNGILRLDEAYTGGTRFIVELHP
ncbi:MAG: sensor histidine kinase [Bacteroidales bacterium]|nr:sensor histidine kinase [Bacteroidales bacterium]